jgi:hypothetical protein
MQLLAFNFLFGSLFLSSATHAFTEPERLAAYHARNWTWPIPEFQPNTEGWDRLMRRRLRQVEEIENKADRFEGFAQTISSALIQPNYTEVSYLCSVASSLQDL